MPDEMNELIKLLQAGLHDQIGALKADTESATGDAKAALELAAEMEKKLGEVTEDRQRFQVLVGFIDLIVKDVTRLDLEVRQNRALVGIDSLCSQISIGSLALAIAEEHEEQDEQELVRFLWSAFSAIFVARDFTKQILEVTKTEELDTIIKQFASTFMTMQEPLLEYMGKRAEGG